MAGGAGAESQKYQEFLLGIDLSSILQQTSGNSQLHAGTTSECVRVECGALLDFDFACGVLLVLHRHPRKCSSDQDAQRSSVVHNLADLCEAGDSQPGTC